MARKKFPRVPYAAIRWMVGNIHVGKSNEDVADKVAERLRKSGATADELAEAIEYAVAVHRSNRALYLVIQHGYSSTSMTRRVERQLAGQDGYGRLLSSFKV